MVRSKIIIIILMLFFFCCITLYSAAVYNGSDNASDHDHYSKREVQIPGNMYISFIRTFFALVFVLALLALMFYFFQKYYYKGIYRRFNQNKALCVYDSVSIGTDKHLCIVSVKKRYFLIGITQANISLIAELDDDFSKNEEDI